MDNRQSKIPLFSIALLLVFGLFLFGLFGFSNHAKAAVVISQQTDGSISSTINSGCSNACSNVTFGSQIFTPSVSGNLGSLEVFTANFSTNSSNPDTNNCFVRIYNQISGAFLAQSGNQFTGFSCAGNSKFTFYNSQPFLETGGQYRWDFVFGIQNFTTLTFFGSPNNTVGGTFNVPPVVNAKFTAFATVAPPTSLSQSDGISAIAESGVTNSTNVVLSVLLPSVAPDSLQLQAELRPSHVAFTNQPNFVSAFVDSGSIASIPISGLSPGGYHWQARSVDIFGNASEWRTISSPPANPDFAVYNPSSDIVVQDTTAQGIPISEIPVDGYRVEVGESGIVSVVHELVPSADTYLKKGTPNKNQGTEEVLRIRASGHNRALISFDLSQFPASSTILSATLALTISHNADNWSSGGRTIDIHRVTQNWTELGATWNCGIDSNTSNSNDNDCNGTNWEMDQQAYWPFIQTPADTELITNGLRGTITFDVTQDVQNFINNTNPNYGWIIKKANEGLSGHIEFESRETTNSPELIVKIQ